MYFILNVSMCEFVLNLLFILIHKFTLANTYHFKKHIIYVYQYENQTLSALRACGAIALCLYDFRQQKILFWCDSIAVLDIN